MERRRFLRSASVATAGIVALAGCGERGPGVNETNGDGESPVGDGAGTDEPTETGMEPETETETETATETEGTETDGGTETTRDDVDLDETVGERPEGIEVSSTELITDIDLIRVTGVIENTGNRTFEEVEVQVTLLDDNDEIIGQFFHDTEEAEVQSLEPGQQWEFSVDFPEEDGEDAVSYRIDVDTDIDQSVDYQETTATETA